MKKGDLVLVPFPFTDLSGSQVRPALVLYATTKGEDCIVAFISSLLTKKVRLFDVRVQKSKQNGLKADSLVRVDKIATLQQKSVLCSIGTLEQKLLVDVNSKLKPLLQL